MKPQTRELALDILVDAVPSAPEPFLSTMEIWHRTAHSRPPFTTARNFLRGWAAAGCGLVREGGAGGRQRYRYDDSC